MTKTFCDICGQELYPSFTEPIYKIDMKLTNGIPYSGQRSYSYGEVCSKCTKNIASYIDRIPKLYERSFDSTKG